MRSVNELDRLDTTARPTPKPEPKPEMHFHLSPTMEAPKIEMPSIPAPIVKVEPKITVEAVKVDMKPVADALTAALKTLAGMQSDAISALAESLATKPKEFRVDITRDKSGAMSGMTIKER